MTRRTLFSTTLLPFLRIADLPVWAVRCTICPNVFWFDKAGTHSKYSVRMMREEAQKVLDFRNADYANQAELVFLPDFKR